METLTLLLLLAGAAGLPSGAPDSDPEPFAGYTLFAPLKSTPPYLIDMKGAVVHEWPSEHNPGNSVYLLEDGSILRCAREGGNPTFRGGGEGGRIQRIGWDGALLWDFLWSDEGRLHHHDIEPMPSGNVLLISWERKSEAEALAAGRDPALLEAGELWPDAVFEIRPEGPTGGAVVWEWHAWDHLIQDRDPAKAGYGVVAEHPERIDVNGEQTREVLDEEGIADLAELGYIGDDEEEDEAEDSGSADDPQGRRGGAGFRGADWMHTNSIDYHPGLDQILLSVRSFNEVWIIDHATTTAEAAGPRGDLLYRWGNPQTWMAGTEQDRQLFVQHDAQWIEAGSPGAGNLLVFNNGMGRASGNWSSVDEIALPAEAGGGYALAAGAFGPRKASWRYRDADKGAFYSGRISGAQRLPNGNTLVCSGEQGRLFEVSPAGEMVWEYRNRFGGEVGGAPGGRRGGRDGGDARRPGRPEGPPPGRPPGPPPGGRGGRGGGFGPTPGGGPGRGGSGGGMGDAAVFRATRVAPGHPGLKALETPAPEPAD